MNDYMKSDLVCAGWEGSKAMLESVHSVHSGIIDADKTRAESNQQKQRQVLKQEEVYYFIYSRVRA